VTAILAIVAALVPLLVWWIRRSAEKKDDPIQQHRERTEQIDQDIAKRDSLAATRHATDDLDELDRVYDAHGGDSSGPNGNVPEKG
jgi:hypothetical protein